MVVLHIKDGLVLENYTGLSTAQLEEAIGGLGGQFIEHTEVLPQGSPWPPPEPSPINPQPEPPHHLTADEVVRWAGEQIAGLLRDVPSQEMITWQTQTEEASGVLAGEDGPFPLIDAQSQVTGETRTQLAQKIQFKTGQLAQISGVIIGLRRHYLGLIESGATPTRDTLAAALKQALGGSIPWE